MSEALRKAQEVMAARRAAGEKIVVLNPIEKAAANPKSLRLAINGKCFDCVGAGHDPNPRKEIGQCPSTDCPLWNVRPYQRYAIEDSSAGDPISSDDETDPLGWDGGDDLI